jgi:hypothetical protein
MNQMEIAAAQEPIGHNYSARVRRIRLPSDASRAESYKIMMRVDPDHDGRIGRALFVAVRRTNSTVLRRVEELKKEGFYIIYDEVDSPNSRYTNINFLEKLGMRKVKVPKRHNKTNKSTASSQTPLRRLQCYTPTKHVRLKDIEASTITDLDAAKHVVELINKYAPE